MSLVTIPRIFSPCNHKMDLQQLIDHKVLILTTDGRILVGTMKGCDQTVNLVLANTVERVFTIEEYSEVELGLYLIRGDTVVTVGLLDDLRDQLIDWTSIKVEPIRELNQHAIKQQSE